jgi:tRNA (guanine26-N2/guanine27-N2)-dimethyltransferase
MSLGDELGFPVKCISEGHAKILVPHGVGEVDPSSLPVFYNPASKISRDLAVLAVEGYFAGKTGLSMCEPLAGCGVRTIRIMLESGVMERAVAGDINKNAAKLISANAAINGLSERVKALHIDANLLLAKMHAEHERVDYVDIDPAGSPARFLENACRATSRNGLLGASATDLAALSGASASTALWRYGVHLAKTVFLKEVAARTLAGFIVMSASRLGLAARPVLTVVHRHFVRVFASLDRGRSKALEASSEMGYLVHCRACLSTRKAAFPALIDGKCQECGGQLVVLGPLWLGVLSDEAVLNRMLKNSKIDDPTYGDAYKILRGIAGEIQDIPYYYPVAELARRAKTSPPKVSRLVEKLRELGYKASTMHHDNSAIKTDAPPKTLLELVRDTAA